MQACMDVGGTLLLEDDVNLHEAIETELGNYPSINWWIALRKQRDLYWEWANGVVIGTYCGIMEV